MGDSQNPVARKDGLIIQEMAGEVLVYDTAIHKAFCLNETAAAVWKHCDGNNSVDNIAASMREEFKAEIPEDLVLMALGQLEKDHLLESFSAPMVSQITRRAAMRKIAAASVVMSLPVIASLAVPANAGVASACACINPGNCAAQTGCSSLVNCNGSGVCAP
jgi:hypothetical protein